MPIVKSILLFALLIFEQLFSKWLGIQDSNDSNKVFITKAKQALPIIETVRVNPFLLVIIKPFAPRNPLDSDTEYVRVEDPLTAVGRTFISALLASGFREVYDDNRFNAEFLPCPLGTFYNSSSRGEQGCTQCPPGKLLTSQQLLRNEQEVSGNHDGDADNLQLTSPNKRFNGNKNGSVHAVYAVLCRKIM